MSKTAAAGVLGIFSDLDATLRSARALQQEGFADLTIYSPTARHEIFAVMESGVSPVRLWTLVGGIIGGASGFALTILTSLDWPLRTGGQPIVSIPPFVIIAFELTILLGALGAVAGFLLSARLPHKLGNPAYDPRFSEDRFGVFVRCAERSETVQEILRRSGAEEVRVENT